MKRMNEALLLVPILFFGTLVPGFCGDNPYSEDTVNNTSGKAVEVYTAPEPIGQGQRVEGTVDVSTSLNIRTSPWGDILGTLDPGAKVTILGQVGDWYKIEHNGQTAYVHSVWVKRPGEGPKPFPRSGWVNSATGLKIRRVPYGDEIGAIQDQTPVEILGVSGEYYKIRYGDNEAFVAKKYIDTNVPSSPEGGKVQPLNFIGYVSAEEGLNVRSSPWGPIDTTLPAGIAVKVTGKVDDWYRIDYNGKTRYVHANFIERSRGDSVKPVTTASTTGGSGTIQQRIVSAGRNLIGSRRFRGPEVDYGNLACAQVVSTALVSAGAIPAVLLNVRSVIDALHKQGWKEVTVPPFQEGDVITWKTYDYTGDGVKDPDTHVGIMVKDDYTFKAMNNSSRLRTPRLSDPYSIGPVSRVLRKAA